MVVGCHQQPTIAAIFFDNGSHIIGNIPTLAAFFLRCSWSLSVASSVSLRRNRGTKVFSIFLFACLAFSLGSLFPVFLFIFPPSALSHLLWLYSQRISTI
jgi:VIT1/CCC1 family predicted Fe2+/Mn2+ transporter